GTAHSALRGRRGARGAPARQRGAARARASVADRADRARRRGARSRGLGGTARARLPRAGDPTAHRAPRHVAPARRALGRAHGRANRRAGGRARRARLRGPVSGGPRPRALLVVAGTATDVGKTWVSVCLLGALRAYGWRVGA